MLQINKLSKKIGDLILLDDISVEFSFALSPIVVLGPSGAGKTTLLRCINFLEESNSGTIFFNGKEIKANNVSEYRKKSGMIFQDFNLFPHMTVLENIIYTPVNVRKICKIDTVKEASKILEKMGLSGYNDIYPSSLSGGEKQRVAIARALILNPSILFLDEPTSALDTEAIATLLNILRNIKKDTILTIITHDIYFAKSIAKYILLIDNGKIAEFSDAKIFFSSPVSSCGQRLLESYRRCVSGEQ